jgi:hypothetical protein
MANIDLLWSDRTTTINALAVVNVDAIIKRNI